MESQDIDEMLMGIIEKNNDHAVHRKLALAEYDTRNRLCNLEQRLNQIYKLQWTIIVLILTYIVSHILYITFK